MILASGQGIYIEAGMTYQRQHHPHLLTGPDGRFSFSPPEGDSHIIALHDQGYAEVTVQRLAKPHELTLESWGRIAGTLRVGGRPLPYQTVVADLDDERHDSNWLRIQNDSRAHTDEQGHFLIERLPPGNRAGILAARAK